MADFLINVIVNPSGAVSGSKQVERALDGVERKATGLERVINRAFLFAGVAAGIRTLAGFDQAMSTVAAVSGATEAQLGQLSSTARELGISTRFSATQAAEGMLELSRAGFEVNETLIAIDDTLVLAQAGALGLNQAAEITGTTLRGFRLAADQATRVVDVLAKAANASNADVTDLGHALSFVAPIAAGVGVELEETVAAIGALSDAGLKGSAAGTGLRRVISELENPSTAATEILRGLGLQTNEVAVSQVGLTTALQRLSEAGVSTADALQIFGDRGGPAFEVLASNLPRLQQLTGALNDSAGSAAAVAAVMDDNLNGALLALRSALEGLILSLGEAGATDILETAIRSAAAAVRFLADNIEILIGVLGALSLRALPAAAAAAARFGVALAVSLGPIGIIVTAVGAIIGALVAFSDQIAFTSDGFVTLSTLSQAVFEELQSVATTALTFVTEQFRNLTATLTDLFGPAVAQVITYIAELLPTFDEVLAGARAFVNRFIGTFVGLGRAMQVIFGAVGRLVSETFENLFGITIPDFVKSTLDFAARGLRFIRDQALDLLRAVGVGAAQVKSFIDDVEFTLPEFALPDGLVQLGIEAKDAFLSGYDTDYVGEMLGILEGPYNRIIERARELGRQAAAEAAAGAAEAPPPAAPVLEEIAGPRRDPAFEAVLADLEREGMLLQLNSRERERRIELFRIEEELGRTLSAIERAQVEGLLIANQALADQAAILEELNGPQDRLIAGTEALNTLLASGAISLDQYNQALRELKLAALEADTSGLAGFQRALLRIEEQATNTGAMVEQFVTGSFNKAADAIAEFATTGEGSFRDLVSSILADLVRLLSQKLLFELLQGVIGGAGGGGGGNFLSGLSGLLGGGGGGGGLPAFANGGNFDVGGSGGTDSQLVAFRATPGENVAISPRGGNPNVNVAAPNVTVPVQVVNVQDPNEIPAAMQSQKGQEVILNAIRANPDAVRAITR